MIFTVAAALVSLSQVGRNPFSAAPDAAAPMAVARQIAPPVCGTDAPLDGDVQVASSGNAVLYRSADGKYRIVTKKKEGR